MLVFLGMQEGVPLISKRLTSSDCEALVSKITARIDSWLARNLSFTRRLQLLSSVLLSLQVYWTNVFILPKKIIHMLEQKFNRFLWMGKDSKAHAKVAWHHICVPKREGGLGLKRLEVWNQASMLNHIWSLFAKAGSLWVAWVESTWLKGRSFWQIPIPQACSWSWKRLLKLCDIAKLFIRFKVGNGSRIFLWFDQWHPFGYLLDNLGHRVVYDAGFPVGSKLSAIIRNGSWFWPYARSDTIVAIQSKLTDVPIGNTNLPVWKSSNGIYSCSATWELLREKCPAVVWWKIVWFSMSIPRHSFILWLVFRDALVTKHRMCSWGFTGPSNCLFCHGCIESRDHLFFLCGFSRRIWFALMKACGYSDPPSDWDLVVVRSVVRLKGKSLKSCLAKLYLGACIYHLWKQRNALLHGITPKTEEVIFGQIRWEVRSSMLAKVSVKPVDKDLPLALQWNLFPLL